LFNKESQLSVLAVDKWTILVAPVLYINELLRNFPFSFSQGYGVAPEILWIGLQSNKVKSELLDAQRLVTCPLL
ncbi:hypothetical protein ACQP3C_27880, partial [Escherichia coli]